MSNDHDQTSGAANKPYTVSAKKPAAVAISNALRRFHLPLLALSCALLFLSDMTRSPVVIGLTTVSILLTFAAVVTAWWQEAKP